MAWFFDGDGGFTIHGKTRRISLTSTHNQNWDFLYELCNQLNIGHRYAQWKSKENSSSSIYFENEAWVKKFFAYIYQGEKFGLLRKYNAYLGYLDYKTTSYKNKTSKYRGVRRNEKKKDGWVMMIYKGKQHLKYFESELDAAKEYDRMAKQLHGNKAVLNFNE